MNCKKCQKKINTDNFSTVCINCGIRYEGGVIDHFVMCLLVSIK